MRLIDTSGRPIRDESISRLATGNLVWVDQVNGNDFGGVRGRMDRPFKTLAAAKAVAVVGDTIAVLPGTYTEGNLALDGVAWWFWAGAIVSSSVSIFNISTTAGLSAGTSSVPKSLKVYGAGRFIITNTTWTTVAACLYLNLDYWNIEIECLSMECIGAGGTNSCLFAEQSSLSNCNALVTAKDLLSRSNPAVISLGSGTFRVNAQRVMSQVWVSGTYLDGGRGIEMRGGSLVLTADVIYGGDGIALQCYFGGTTVVTAREIFTSCNAPFSTVSFDGGASTLLWIYRARILGYGVGTMNNSSVSIGSGSTGADASVRLYDCTLLPGGTAVSIDSVSASKVSFYGALMQKNGDSANVTLQNYGTLVTNPNMK